MPQSRHQRCNVLHARAKYGGVEMLNACKLKGLDENAKLKTLLAEEMLDVAMLKEMPAKKF